VGFWGGGGGKVPHRKKHECQFKKEIQNRDTNMKESAEKKEKVQVKEPGRYKERQTQKLNSSRKTIRGSDCPGPPNDRCSNQKDRGGREPKEARDGTSMNGGATGTRSSLFGGHDNVEQTILRGRREKEKDLTESRGAEFNTSREEKDEPGV